MIKQLSGIFQHAETCKVQNRLLKRLYQIASSKHGWERIDSLWKTNVKYLHAAVSSNDDSYCRIMLLLLICLIEIGVNKQVYVCVSVSKKVFTLTDCIIIVHIMFQETCI